MKKVTLQLQNKEFSCLLDEAIDISIPLRRNMNVNAFYLPGPKMETFETEGFTGDVNRGGNCNVENISLSPHGNGTHTECIGHISNEKVFIGNVLKKFHFLARLIDVEIDPASNSILAGTIEKALAHDKILAEALIIRTFPNSDSKLYRDYSGNNPPFLSAKAAIFINSLNIPHLLIDLPSIDKEDDPELQSHHIFWNYPHHPENKKTITEMVFVPTEAEAGFYLLNLQVLNLESDASPSRPVLFKINQLIN